MPHLDSPIVVFDGNVIVDATVAETQGGDEAQVKIAAKSLAADDAHREARTLLGFNVIHIQAPCCVNVYIGHGPCIDGTRHILVAFLGLDGVHHLVVCQKETEMVGLIFVVSQIADGPSLCRCGQGKCGEKDCYGDYFQRVFQDAVCFDVSLTGIVRFYCGKPAAKLGKNTIPLHFWCRIKRGNAVTEASCRAFRKPVRREHFKEFPTIWEAFHGVGQIGIGRSIFRDPFPDFW